MLWNELKLSHLATFANFWGSYSEIHLRGAYYDDRELGVDGDGPRSNVRRPRRLRRRVDRSAPPPAAVFGGDVDKREGGWHFDAIFA